MVELTSRDFFKKPRVLGFDDFLGFRFKIRVVQEGSVVGFSGDKNLSRCINDGFDVMSLFSFILGLDVDPDSSVLDFRIESTHEDTFFSIHYYTLNLQYIKGANPSF